MDVVPLRFPKSITTDEDISSFLMKQGNYANEGIPALLIDKF